MHFPELVHCASVTRWVIYWTLGHFLKPLATIIFPKSPTFLGNFCKGVIICHFSSEIIFGQLLQTFDNDCCQVENGHRQHKVCRLLFNNFIPKELALTCLCIKLLLYSVFFLQAIQFFSAVPELRFCMTTQVCRQDKKRKTHPLANVMNAQVFFQLWLQDSVVETCRLGRRSMSIFTP